MVFCREPALFALRRRVLAHFALLTAAALTAVGPAEFGVMRWLEAALMLNPITLRTNI